MASFVLTTGTDNFAGTNGVVDNFDAITFGSLTSVDTISGGTGVDFMSMGAESYNADRMLHVTGIENFSFFSTSAASLVLTANIGATAEGRQVVVQATGPFTLNASAFTSADQLYYVSQGSGQINTVTGGGGDDFFNINGTLAAGSSFNGGNGYDRVGILTGGPLGIDIGANFSNMENFSLLLGSSIRFTAGFSAPGGIVDVVLNSGANNRATVVAGATTAIRAQGGTGNDTILCSVSVIRNDEFVFYSGALSGADTIAGGGGTGDSLVFKDSVIVASADLAGITAVERVRLEGVGANQITLRSSMLTNVASGQIDVTGNFGGDTVNGSSFGATQSLYAKGLGGNDVLTGGGGEDLLIGGENEDDLFGGGADDFLLGGNGADELFGGAGNDNLRGNAGADRLDGGTGDDFASYTTDTGAVQIFLDGITANTGAAAGDVFISIEHATGTDGFDDTITGNTQNNKLYGNGGADILRGGDGNDTLRGGAGADTLSGAVGVDTFQYLAASEGGDTITGFSSIDIFAFASAAFGGLPTGALAASRFQSRATDNFAQDSTDRFIFRQSDDTLWYDSNGGNGTAAGAANAVLIATIQTNAVLAAADIVIF